MADAEDVARVHVAGWQSAYRGVLGDDYLDGLHWSDRYEFWSSELDGPEIAGSGTWVAVWDDLVVGFAGAGPSRDEDLQSRIWWELYGIYVMSDVWGRGVGCLLMERVLGATPPHVEQVSLWVLAENTRARRFYERQGMCTDGRELTVEIGGEDVVEVRYAGPVPRRI